MKTKQEVLHDSTKDYSLFKVLKGNRTISPFHIENLKKSIQTRNHLDIYPVIVNEKFEVIDGQHRLEAAKQLGLEVHYALKEGLNYIDAMILNACSDNWELNEYLEGFCKNGLQPYLEFKKLLTDCRLTIRRFEHVCSKDQKNLLKEKFKKGEFKVVEDKEKLADICKKTESVIKFLDETLIREQKSFLHKDNFWKALVNFYSIKDVDHDKFMEKLSVKYQSIGPMSGHKDYLTTFLQIYNWKAKARV